MAEQLQTFTDYYLAQTKEHWFLSPGATISASDLVQRLNWLGTWLDNNVVPQTILNVSVGAGGSKK